MLWTTHNHETNRFAALLKRTCTILVVQHMKMLNQKNVKSVTFCPSKWSRTIWLPRASWIVLSYWTIFDLSMPVPSTSEALCDLRSPPTAFAIVTFVQHFSNICEMCHSVTLVRGLDGSLDRPRSSYAFARLIRESQSIGKCWNTHWNCAAINNLLKQNEHFFLLFSGYFPASLFSIFDSSTLRIWISRNFKCQQMNRAILQAST